MLSNQILGFFWPSQDQVFIEIGIDSEQPVEALVVKSVNVKGVMNDMPHLKKMVKKIQCEQLEKLGYTLLGENEESAKSVFTGQVIEYIAKSPCVHMVHLTDQHCYSPYPLVLKVTLNIGETVETLDASAKFFGQVLNVFIDTFAKLKLSEHSLNASKKN